MQEALTQLQSELKDANALLRQAATELGNPLGELVQGQIRSASPPLRAAFVLTAGYSSPHTETTRHRRILLAAALELLHVALNIHILLVNASLQSGDNGAANAVSDSTDPSVDAQTMPKPHAQESLDKTFIGSTILAGDYCFSRSAQFAAQTDSPLVVERFAQALQTVSESNLRRIFGTSVLNEENSSSDAHALLQAGTLAAVELSTMTAEEKAISIDLCTDFVRFLNLEIDESQLVEQIGNSPLHTEQTKRWLALSHWISQPTSQPTSLPTSQSI